MDLAHNAVVLTPPPLSGPRPSRKWWMPTLSSSPPVEAVARANPGWNCCARTQLFIGGIGRATQGLRGKILFVTNPVDVLTHRG